MKKVLQYSFHLLILSSLLTAAGFIFVTQLSIGLSLLDIALLTLSFYATVEISLLIFLRGQKKDAQSQAFYTLVSISFKFLVELIIALIWFLIAKKTSISSVLLFFVLYLTFTLFSIFVILNTLKNKSL